MEGHPRRVPGGHTDGARATSAHASARLVTNGRTDGRWVTCATGISDHDTSDGDSTPDVPTGEPRPRRPGARRTLLVLVLLAAGCTASRRAAAPPVTEPATQLTAPTTTTAPPTTTTAAAPTTSSVDLGPLAPPTLTPGTVATSRSAGVLAYADLPDLPGAAAADWSFSALTQFGSPTTFLVTATQGDWLRVVLPIRQNGTEAWIAASDVALSTVPFRLVISVGQRRVVLWRGDQRVVDTTAVVGEPSTPTPEGLFYVTDLLDTGDPDGAYGPYIVALSARSDAFDWFNGGEPLVGVHGTNAPWLLGTAASHGCVRIPNDVVTQLVGLLPLGTPVHVIA